MGASRVGPADEGSDSWREHAVGRTTWPPYWTQQRIEDYCALVSTSLLLDQRVVLELVAGQGTELEPWIRRIESEYSAKRELLRLHAPQRDGTCGVCVDPGTYRYPEVVKDGRSVVWVHRAKRRSPWPCATYDLVARPVLRRSGATEVPRVDPESDPMPDESDDGGSANGSG